jgi:hypothetical protein
MPTLTIADETAPGKNDPLAASHCAIDRYVAEAWKQRGSTTLQMPDDRALLTHGKRELSLLLAAVLRRIAWAKAALQAGAP